MSSTHMEFKFAQIKASQWRKAFDQNLPKRPYIPSHRLWRTILDGCSELWPPLQVHPTFLCSLKKSAAINRSSFWHSQTSSKIKRWPATTSSMIAGNEQQTKVSLAVHLSSLSDYDGLQRGYSIQKFKWWKASTITANNGKQTLRIWKVSSDLSSCICWSLPTSNWHAHILTYY